MGNSQGWVSGTIGDAVRGKHVVVTGASSGLGLETVRVLAKFGAIVTMAVRNQAKTEPLLQQLMTAMPEAQIDILILDLEDLESVREFAKKYKETHTKLDILVNNAGIMGSCCLFRESCANCLTLTAPPLCHGSWSNSTLYQARV